MRQRGKLKPVNRREQRDGGNEGKGWPWSSVLANACLREELKRARPVPQAGNSRSNIVIPQLRNGGRGVFLTRTFVWRDTLDSSLSQVLPRCLRQCPVRTRH